MGLATAHLMGADHRVVVNDLDPERVDAAVAQLRAAGVDAAGIACDIADTKQVGDMIRGVEEDGPHLRAIVHAAGVSPQMGDPTKVLRINALGTLNVSRAYLPIAAEGDALVHVASYAGYSIPGLLKPKRVFRKAATDYDAFAKGVLKFTKIAKGQESGITYAISKAFVQWHAREQAGGFGAKGARVLSVSPGSFDTAMGKLEKDHGAGDLLKTAAIKRFGRPEEIAAVLAFCASDAPGYLTGMDVLVDGGTLAGKEFKRSS